MYSVQIPSLSQCNANEGSAVPASLEPKPQSDTGEINPNPTGAPMRGWRNMITNFFLPKNRYKTHESGGRLFAEQKLNLDIYDYANDSAAIKKIAARGKAAAVTK